MDAIQRSPHHNIFMPNNVPLHTYVTQYFANYGNKAALIDVETNESYTYIDLLHKIRVVASALKRLYFQQGDVLALFTNNHIDFPIVTFAVLSIGGTVAMINSNFTSHELITQLRDCAATFLVTSEKNRPLALKSSEVLSTQIKQVITLGSARDYQETSVSMDYLKRDDGSAFPTNVNIDVRKHVAFLPYSSGTTGTPKGVMLTHYNLVANLIQACSSEDFNWAIPCSRDVTLAVLPYWHGYALFIYIVGALYRGATIINVPNFSLNLLLHSVQNFKVTILHLVPPIMIMLAKSEEVSKYNLSSVKAIMTAAAPLGKDIVEQIQNNIGVDQVCQGYGLTETSPILTISPLGVARAGSVGKLVPNTECKIMSSTHIETGAARGEICVRGPQIMLGYLRKPEATADAIDLDGWFHTGDVGYFDDDGYLYVVDRIKEIIKWKGEQVSPAELEAVLITHPDVIDAAVIGQPDDVAGELPVAFIAAAPITKMSMESLGKSIIQYVRDRVAPHKRLRGGVRFVDQIPKSPSGKILRRLLKDKLHNLTSKL